MTGAEWLLATVVIAAGAAVQGSVGFGMNVVAAPVLVLVDPRWVPGPLLIAASALTVGVAVRERRSLRIREVGTAVAGRVPGTLLAGAAVAAVSQRGLTILFGTLVLGAVALSAAGLRLRPTPRTLLVAGFLSGFMGTTTSIGGPPMALVYQGTDGPHMRATMSGFFVIGTLMSLATLAAVGALGAGDVARGLSLLPGVAGGLWLSRHGAGLLDAGWTRPAVLVVAAAAAVAALLRALV